MATALKKIIPEFAKEAPVERRISKERFLCSQKTVPSRWNMPAPKQEHPAVNLIPY